VNYTINYDRVYDMKTLVLIHGFGVDSRVFEPISEELSRAYEILLVDLPGHGKTDVPFDNFEHCSHVIANVISSSSSNRVSVLGWSMGGQIILRLPELVPGRIESLTLLSSTPKFVASEEFKFGYNKSVFKKFFKGVKSDTARAMRGFYELMFSRTEESAPYLVQLKNMMPKENTLVKCMGSLEKDDQRDILPKISMPTLIISGSEDEICSPQASVYMAKKIPNAKLITFDGGGHMLQLTRSGELIDAIKTFVG
jgi:pimeloyl-[acyl-carrier protein] methyl ester esterase